MAWRADSKFGEPREEEGVDLRWKMGIFFQCRRVGRGYTGGENLVSVVVLVAVGLLRVGNWSVLENGRIYTYSCFSLSPRNQRYYMIVLPIRLPLLTSSDLFSIAPGSSLL